MQLFLNIYTIFLNFQRIVDIFFRFKDKTENDKTSDIFDYGEIVKRLIRRKLNHDRKC